MKGKIIQLLEKNYFEIGKDFLNRTDIYTTYGASLAAQMVKNLPAMRETQVQFLGWEDFQEKGMATHSSILAWRILWTEEPWQATVHGTAKSWTRLSNNFTFIHSI